MDPLRYARFGATAIMAGASPTLAIGTPDTLPSGPVVHVFASCQSDSTSYRLGMWTTGTDRQTSTSGLAEKFDRLADMWRRETAGLSSPNRITMHPAYQAIIALGEEVVPFILDRMNTSPSHWFAALRAIYYPTDPVPRDDWGDVDAMHDHWVRWIHEHHRQR